MNVIKGQVMRVEKGTVLYRQYRAHIFTDVWEAKKAVQHVSERIRCKMHCLEMGSQATCGEERARILQYTANELVLWYHEWIDSAQVDIERAKSCNIVGDACVRQSSDGLTKSLIT